MRIRESNVKIMERHFSDNEQFEKMLLEAKGLKKQLQELKKENARLLEQLKELEEDIEWKNKLLSVSGLPGQQR